MDDGGYMETLEMLAATMAHEVKNPLALIQANVDFIELCDKEKRHSANCRVIKEELRKTNEMLSGFIGLLSVNYSFDEEVDICGVVSNVVEHYKRGTGEGVELRLGRPAEKLLIRGNAQLLNIAISNIVKNAMEAVNTNGTVSVSVYEADETCVVTVEDDGGGVSQEAQQALSDLRPFTTKPHGNGIGLGICRKIIEEHNGIFEMNNRNDGIRGCVIKISLQKGG